MIVRNVVDLIPTSVRSNLAVGGVGIPADVRGKEVSRELVVGRRKLYLGRSIEQLLDVWRHPHRPTDQLSTLCLDRRPWCCRTSGDLVLTGFRLRLPI